MHRGDLGIEAVEQLVLEKRRAFFELGGILQIHVEVHCKDGCKGLPSRQ